MEGSNDSIRKALDTASADYTLIEKMIGVLENHPRLHPSLEDLAHTVGLSVYQIQRLFSRWVGISPKRFCQYLTKEYAKELLMRSSSVLETTYESGLSSPSRLHDLFLTTEAVRPGDIRSRGAGLEIRYGYHPSPFGQCLIGVTEKGVCALRFLREGMTEDDLVLDLRRQWPRAHILHDPGPSEQLLDRIFPYPLWEWTATVPPPGPLHLYVQGTNFQIKVWEALIRIPLGEAVSYEELAQRVGNAKASRAVGSAVGDNLIPFLIPCHRVLRKCGDFGAYGEGPLRKKAILAWEAAVKDRVRLFNP
ncbi:MAG: methylated-DNA--[protein]-cysteine S-methyltransferase [Spirochaetes bacterium]|nr:methylated-DNA--[protein]-cysteine S-methyltransferase [Spirochaetota bacterium]